VPTYQYVCNHCGEDHEAVQKFSDDALTECPACGGKLRKVYSAVGVVFKGSGFYRNDSRSTGSSATAGSAGKTDTAAAAASTPASSSSSTSSTDGSSSTTSTPAPAAAPSVSKKSGDSKVA
jgi:putative FmdB family regulatory protein